MKPPKFEELLKKKNLSLSFDIEAGNFVADEKILRHVFARLIENAAKFAESSSEIVVTARNVNQKFKIEIYNQAPLITPEKIKSLMKSFTLNEDAFNHSSGNGLGLSICQALLKLQETQLKFESNADGVRVSFDFESV